MATVVLLGLATAVLSVASAWAAPLTVTKTADTADGQCTAADCSLREAVIASNGTVGANTIVLPAGQFTLTIAGSNAGADQGDLNITQSVTITGAGAAATTIDGDRIDRIFNVECPITDPCNTGLTLSGLTLTGGAPAPLAGHYESVGGAVLFGTGGTLTIADSVLSGNVASYTYGGRGGAIALSADGATLSLANTTMSSNQAGGTGPNAAGWGGAVYATYGGTTSTTMSMTGATFTGNVAGGGGGGAMGDGGAVYQWHGSLAVSGSTFTGNHAGGGGGNAHAYGGAIETAGTVTITDSGFDTNIAGGWGGNAWGYGGALYKAGSGAVSIARTVLTNNHAGDGGNGNSFGGAASLASSDVSITDSVLSGNTVGGGSETAYGQGGGLHVGGGTLTRTTVSANTAGGGGAQGYGGGIFVSGALTAISSTVSGNSAGGGGDYGRGGGIEGLAPGGAITLQSSTVAGNSAATVGPEGGGGGIHGKLTTHNSIIADNSAAHDANCGGGTVTSHGHNLENGASCGLGGVDDVSAEPMLGPLADNGGLTTTRALLAGSPAINTGDNGGCPTSDQRGVSRPQPPGGTCDIGAYEYSPPSSSASLPASCSATNLVPFTVTTAAGAAAPTAIHYKLDAGAEKRQATTGNPGTATITIGTGTHTLEYCGESSGGDLEFPHHSATVCPAAPTAPSISRVNPTSGPANGGTRVKISGSALSDATAVKFGRATARSFTVNSATQITATSPRAAPGTVDVTVTTLAGTSRTTNADRFTYFGTPTLSRASLGGVAKHKSKLALTLTAGRNAAPLKAFSVSLPPGLTFSKVKGNLNKGVTLKNARGRSIKFTARLSRGVLTITPKTPNTQIRLTIQSRAITASERLAAKAKRRQAGRVTIIVTTTDTSSNTNRITVTLKLS